MLSKAVIHHYRIVNATLITFIPTETSLNHFKSQVSFGNRVFSGEIYTTGKKFTPTPGGTGGKNLTSEWKSNENDKKKQISPNEFKWRVGNVKQSKGTWQKLLS